MEKTPYSTEYDSETNIYIIKLVNPKLKILY